MKKIISLSVVLACAGANSIAYAQAPPRSPQTAASMPAHPVSVPTVWEYFGEAPVGAEPRLFASDQISDGMSNRDMAISPAGDELFYTIQSVRGNVSCILYSHFTGKGWTDPEVSPDKKYLFFTSGKTLFEPPFDKPLKFRLLKQLLQGPGNGLTDIYWMQWQPIVKKYFHGS